MNSSLVRKTSATMTALVLLACTALPACASDRKVVRRVAPIYPQIAKMMHIGGVVRVQATVAPNGEVTQAKAVSGNKMLVPAAEDAIRRWKFAPEAASSTENINIDFEAAD